MVKGERPATNTNTMAVRLGITVAVPLVVVGFLAALSAIFMPGLGGYNQGLLNTWHLLWSRASAAHWAVLMSWAVIAAAAAGSALYQRSEDSYWSRGEKPAKPRTTKVGLAVLAALAVTFVGSLTMLVNTTIATSKDAARYYAQANVFYVPDTSNVPPVLSLLTANSHPGTNGCALVGNADVPSCVKVGTLPQAGFDARVSSANGADYVITHASDVGANVSPDSNSLMYLNGSGNTGDWSEVLDGGGYSTPLYGVAEWDGVENKPTICTYSGNDRVDRALSGGRGNSLTNLIKTRYPTLYWQGSDVWGYCNSADQPVVVIPVERKKDFADSVVDEPAGVILVTGSPSGRTIIDYQSHASNLPGAVYPASIADQQMSALNWQAGRKDHDRAHFGFAPTTEGAQNQNVSDYLLRSKADGHLYWVTPLTPNSSSSQVFVAYAMVRADTVAYGQLNQFSVYVLATGDNREINVGTMEANAKNYLQGVDPGFSSAGGTLTEYTPTGGDIWRAFGELNGRVVYRLDVSATNSVAPVLVSLAPSSTTPGAPGQGQGAGTPTPAPGGSPSAANAACGAAPSTLTQAQIISCLQFFAGQLKNPPVTTTSPAGQNSSK